MSPEEVRLVQTTFHKVSPIAEDAAAMFYGRLFEIDPTLRPLFKGDMKEQGRKLMAMISLAVNGLGSPDKLGSAVRQLGTRHASYGVKAKDYDTVGQALLWTLEKGLGDAFTPQARQAWTAVYVLLASMMKEAAAKAA
ncbi:MAG: globin family protein [Pseudomonadota bacterium]